MTDGDRGRVPARRGSANPTNRSTAFERTGGELRIRAVQNGADAHEEPPGDDSGLDGMRGGEWLGGRDSNPDYTVQSRVSYH